MNCAHFSNITKVAPELVIIPSSQGSSEVGQPHAPKVGAYTNSIVKYEADGKAYIYDQRGYYALLSDTTKEEHGNTLYETLGDHRDGAMTQRATTRAIYSPLNFATHRTVAIGLNIEQGGAEGNLDSVYIGNGINAAQNGNNQVIIGKDASAQPSSESAVALGNSTSVDGADAVALGNSASAKASAVALGKNASATAEGSIALGAGAIAEAKGEINIGADANGGYNDSAFRKITGLFPGENANDAATLGQLPVFTVTNVDPGEGTELADNHFIIVVDR